MGSPWPRQFGGNIMRNLKRFLCLFLVLVVLFYLPIPSYGVAIADDLLVTIALMVLAASGITVSAASIGGDYGAGIGSLLDEFAFSQGSDTFANMVLSYATYKIGPGYIRIGAELANAYANFTRWLRTSFVMSDDTTAVIYPSGETVRLSDGSTVTLTTGTLTGTNYMSDITWGTTWVPGFSNRIKVEFPFCGYICVTGAQGSGNNSGRAVMWQGWSLPGTDEAYNNAWQTSYEYNGTQRIGFTVIEKNGGAVLYSVREYVYQGKILGSLYECTVSGDVVVSSGGGLSLDAGTLDDIGDTPASQDLYLGNPAIGAGMTADQVVDAINDVVVADEGALDVEVGREGITDQPVVPPVSTPEYSVVGLDEIFPFCIPFDLYDFFSVLAAEPEAPYFEWDMDLPAELGGEYTVVIDLDNTTFNTLARLLRTMELLLFCVGLAFVTRRLIRG